MIPEQYSIIDISYPYIVNHPHKSLRLTLPEHVRRRLRHEHRYAIDQHQHCLRRVLLVEERDHPRQNYSKLFIRQGFADFKDVGQEEGEKVYVFQLHQVRF